MQPFPVGRQPVPEVFLGGGLEFFVAEQVDVDTNLPAGSAPGEAASGHGVQVLVDLPGFRLGQFGDVGGGQAAARSGEQPEQVLFSFCAGEQSFEFALHVVPDRSCLG